MGVGVEDEPIEDDEAKDPNEFEVSIPLDGTGAVERVGKWVKYGGEGALGIGDKRKDDSGGGEEAVRLGRGANASVEIEDEAERGERWEGERWPAACSPD